MKRILLAIAVAAAFGAAGSASAQGSRLLGVSTLSPREGDVDVVPLSCRNRVSAVRLVPVNGRAEIERVWVTYGNGERTSVRIDESLRRGESTGWIDLRGGRRCVTSIAVAGDAERRNERVRYDRYDDDDDGYYRTSDRYDDGYRDDRRGRGGWRPVDVEIYGRGW